MRYAVLALSVLFCPLALAETNPSDYPVNVHVLSSRLSEDWNGGAVPVNTERLVVSIEGKKYDLSGYPPRVSHLGKYGLISPGDYKARLLQDEQKSGYLIVREYELLFPDSSTAKFSVIGVAEIGH